MPPRRRSTTTRRPRVAGLNPMSRRAGDDRGAAVALDDAPAAQEQAQGTPVADPAAPATAAAGTDAAGTDAAGTDAAGTDADTTADTTAPPTAGHGEPPVTEAAGGPTSAGAGPSRLRSVPLLAGALVVFLALAVFLAVMDHRVRNTPAASNTALVDVAATAEVSGQLGAALEAIYSYDFARLEENKRAADQVVTPAFRTEFDALWDQVQELAPQRQAVVSATVTQSAVQSIEGDRAVLVAFMDQQATTAAPEGPQQLASAGRLTVVGERVDGVWKIAAVEAR